MSQKPANARGLTAEALATGESGSAEVGVSRVPPGAGYGLVGKRLPPAASAQGAHKTGGSALSTQARPATVSRAATGPVRAVAANDDMPSIGGLIFALQQRPSKSP